MTKKPEIDYHHTLAEDRAAAKKPRTRKPGGSKQQRFRAFAEAFCNIADSTTYLNAYKSAIASGYSQAYARGNAHKLVVKGGIAKEIEAIKAEKRANPKIASADEVLEALTTQIRMLPNKLFDPETKELIKMADMDDRQAQAIAGYKMTQRVIPGSGEEGQPEVETRYEVKLVDRLRALEMLCRWHGIWEKDNRQRAAPTTPVALVAFPTGELSLEEWQRQALVILAEKDAKKAAGP
jgi:phage terminase small subunit